MGGPPPLEWEIARPKEKYFSFTVRRWRSLCTKEDDAAVDEKLWVLHSYTEPPPQPGEDSKTKKIIIFRKLRRRVCIDKNYSFIYMNSARKLYIYV